MRKALLASLLAGAATLSLSLSVEAQPGRPGQSSDMGTESTNVPWLSAPPGSIPGPGTEGTLRTPADRPGSNTTAGGTYAPPGRSPATQVPDPRRAENDGLAGASGVTAAPQSFQAQSVPPRPVGDAAERQVTECLNAAMAQRRPLESCRR